MILSKQVSKAKEALVRGFTLVEMIVVIAIVAMIGSIVIFSGSKFNGTILLTNLAYDIALSVRQAQVYGINVRETSNSSNIFATNYGIRFQKGVSSAKCNNTSDTLYTLFADTNQNHVFDTASPAEPTIQDFCLTRGNTISNIRTVSNSGTNTDLVTNGTLDITFTRPDPNACLNFNVSGTPPSRGVISTDLCTQATAIASAEITVRSPQGSTKKVIIQSTGQISIQ